MKRINQLLLFLLIIIICLIYFFVTKSLFVFVLINLLVILCGYILIRSYYLEKYETKYINEKIKVAKADVLNTADVFILIIRDDKIVWGNENAYKEFPELKTSRKRNFLIENEVDNSIRYNNKIYRILKKGEIYFLINNTETFREERKLRNIQTIIGLFQIDNLDSLKSSLDTAVYFEFFSEFKSMLYDIFINNEIHFQELEEDLYYLNLSYEYIQAGIKGRFKDIGDLVKCFQEKNILVTTSMGIAYNYSDVATTGKKAKEALDLATSRGGAQIILFDNDKRIYFGGGFSVESGSLRLRSRIIASTLNRLVEQKDVIYLMSHKKPDYDAIASLVLLHDYLKDEKKQIKVMIDDLDSIAEYELSKYIPQNDIYVDYVLDNTKKNILIILDTQSKELVSHNKLLDGISELIVIDHHQTPTNYIQGNLFSWIEPGASSTTELIMSIITAGDRKLRSDKTADLSILGILTDTNNLKYRIGYQTLYVLMNLVENGASLENSFKEMYISENLWEEKQKMLTKVKFFGYFSILELDTDDMEYDDFLLSIVADSMLEVKNKKGAIVIYPLNEDEYRIKIRTTNEINARQIIEEFGGGGHASQAAGILNKVAKEGLLEKIKTIN